LRIGRNELPPRFLGFSRHLHLSLQLRTALPAMALASTAAISPDGTGAIFNLRQPAFASSCIGAFFVLFLFEVS